MTQSTTRTERAAATRRALLDEAAALLDAGGSGAVTLREVGARAGVSRGAPYGHFPDKEHLLTAVAAEGWEHIGREVRELHDDPRLSAEQALRAALLVVLTISRQRPHLYQLMFRPPLSDPEAIVRAAQRTCDSFLDIVSGAFGAEDAGRYAAILLTAAHGAAGLETSGLLNTDKWNTTADELVDSLIAMVAED